MTENGFEEGELFISDMGAERCDACARKEIDLKRYAVIRNLQSRGQLQLMEVSDDLDYLMNKYDIDRSHIGRIANAGSEI